MSDIKRDREAILKFQKEIKEMGTSRKAKVMKLGDDPVLDRAKKNGRGAYYWSITLCKSNRS